MEYIEDMVVVNTQQEYHNCAIVYSYWYEGNGGFSVTREQKYKIYTTLEEVKKFNEALHLFQSQGFKEKFLQYNSEIDGSAKYPEFVIPYIDAVTIGKELEALAKDEYPLIQLNDFCLEVAPSYADDFRINKTIEAIIVNEDVREVDGYEDIDTYLSSLGIE